MDIGVYNIAINEIIIFSEIDYGPPADVANSNVVWSGTTMGSIATYSCDEGMEDADPEQILCTVEGWNQEVSSIVTFVFFVSSW